MARSDPYAWMRDVASPDLLTHLQAERHWYDSATGHLSPLVQALRSEMTGRVPATDRSVRTRYHGCSYYTALPAGREYPQLLRDFNAPDGREPTDSSVTVRPDDAKSGSPQLLLDVSSLADGSGHLELGVARVSPDGQLLAYSVDRQGDEVYELHLRDLESGDDLADVVPRTYYGSAWSADSRHFFYTVPDEAYRPSQVWRHTVGTPVEDDVLVLTEPDERFELTVRPARSGELVVLWSSSRDAREVWVLDATDADAVPRSVGGRRDGVEYHAEHARLPDGSEALLVVTDDGAPEFRLARCPVPRAADQDHTSWEPVRPEDTAERLERVDAFATHAVLSYRSGGQTRLRVVPFEAMDGPGTVLAPLLPTGTLALAGNPEPDVAAVTVVEESYVDPPVWSSVDLGTGARTEIHRQEAPGHDPAQYVGERLTFPAPDGTEVPCTIVRHRETPLDGTAPALLYGYGAYEAVVEPEWDPALPSLLDRGVVYVHAHVRGGGELGRRWWLEGRLGHKSHTFTDHLAVADGVAGDLTGRPALVDGSRLATRGLSAGGLLQGAVLSLRPQRWRAVVAEVPFVDVVTTMLDASLPLTAGEWDEWGDPREREQFDWLMAYSPYDNLPAAGDRPDLLVTAALHDPRVTVTEPAKWVAALRATDPEWSPRCVFRVETGAGAHSGPSGRYAHLAYEAEVTAWLLDRLGVATVSPVSSPRVRS